jgi:hypothetical protein
LHRDNRSALSLQVKGSKGPWASALPAISRFARASRRKACGVGGAEQLATHLDQARVTSALPLPLPPAWPTLQRIAQRACPLRGALLLVLPAAGRSLLVGYPLAQIIFSCTQAACDADLSPD